MGKRWCMNAFSKPVLTLLGLAVFGSMDSGMVAHNVPSTSIAESSVAALLGTREWLSQYSEAHDPPPSQALVVSMGGAERS